MQQITEMSHIADVINTLIAVQDNRGFDTSSDTFQYSNALAKKKMKLSGLDMKRLTGHRMINIVCNILAPFSIKQFEEETLGVPYVGIANEMYDRSVACVVQYFDYRQGGVVVKFAHLPDHFLFAATPEVLSNDWKTVLTKNGMDKKVVSYTAEPRFFETIPAIVAGASVQQNKNVFDLLKTDVLKRDIIGYQFRSYVLKDALFKAIETMSLNVVKQVDEIYDFFLNCCSLDDKAAEEHRPNDTDSFFRKDYPYRLENYDIAGWIPLKRAVETILAEYSECQIYFSSDKAEDTREYFLNPFNKGYLIFVLEILRKFPTNFEEFDKNAGTLIGKLAIVNIGSDTSLPPETTKFLADMKGQSDKMAGMLQFKDDVKKFYEFFNKYIAEQTEYDAEFKCLAWMALDKAYSFSQIEQSLIFFKAHKVVIDLAPLSAQVNVLNKFLVKKLKNKKFPEMSSDQKWSEFFRATTAEDHGELLKMVRFAFAIIGVVNHAERMSNLLTDDERWNKDEYLLTGSQTEKIKSLMLVANNLAHMDHEVLKNLIRTDENFLKLK